MKQRVGVLGLDAFSYDYLRKLTDAGAVSFISSLTAKGRAVVLRAVPPVTAPSWSSIMTGVNPGKHGVFSFFHYTKTGDGWRQRVTTSLDLMHPRVHEMASMAGLSSIVFNPIPDYPVLPFPRATIVSNLFFVDRQFSYPRGVGEDFFPDWEKIVTASIVPTCEIVERYVEVLNSYIAATEKAIAKEPDLLWINLNIPDTILHKCVELVDRETMREEVKLYSLVDRLAKIMSDSFDVFMIVSDHGFTGYDTLVSVNDILVREGLAIKTSEPPPLKTVFRAMKKESIKDKELKIPTWLLLTIKKLRLKKPAKAALHLASKLFRREIKVYTSQWVDIARSVAFFPYHLYFGVLLNDTSRRGDVLKSLKKYSDFVIADIPENVYNGPYLNRGPDIVVLPRTDKRVWVNPPYLLGRVYIKDKVYHHHPDGVLIVSGDADDIGYIPDRLPNHAVAQLVMHYLGAPLPKSRDRITELERSVLKDDEEMDYITKWRLALRVMRRVSPRG